MFEWVQNTSPIKTTISQLSVAESFGFDLIWSHSYKFVTSTLTSQVSFAKML